MSLTGGMISAKAYGYNYNKALDSNNARMLYTLLININRKKGQKLHKASEAWPLFIDDIKHKKMTSDKLNWIKKIHNNGS